MAALKRAVNYVSKFTNKFSFYRIGNHSNITNNKRLLLSVACVVGGGLTCYGVSAYFKFNILNSNLSGIVHAATIDEIPPRSVLIKNGSIVNADNIAKKDIFLEDGIIKTIGTNITVAIDTLVIDAEGKYIIPGGIDPHTHMELELMGATTIDDFYTGTRAALAGGTTTIIDFAIPLKGESLIKTYNRYREIAKKSCCDYGLHIGVTWWSNEVKAEMEELCKQHGVNSFKMFMAYKNLWMLQDTELYMVFKTCRKLGAVALIHAENGDIILENQKKLLKLGFRGPEGHLLSRPEEVEAEAVNRACVIANQVLCPLYVVHIMSKAASTVMAEKRKEGMIVYGETLVAALGTDGTHYFNTCWRHAAGHIVAPPLRPDATTSPFLVNLLKTDGLQAVGSDHCVFSSNQKFLGREDFTKIPFGVNGVEDRMSVTWEKGVHLGQMDPMRFVEITSTNVAKIFNLYPKKGCIEEGSDADIVVWDPNKTHKISAKKHYQAVDFNIFEGMECHGVPEYVFLRGHMVVNNGKLHVQRGMGQFLSMETFPKYVYESVHKKEEADRVKPVTRYPSCATEEVTVEDDDD